MLSTGFVFMAESHLVAHLEDETFIFTLSAIARNAAF